MITVITANMIIGMLFVRPSDVQLLIAVYLSSIAPRLDLHRKTCSFNDINQIIYVIIVEVRQCDVLYDVTRNAP
jgi:hypothetical protein